MRSRPAPRARRQRAKSWRLRNALNLKDGARNLEVRDRRRASRHGRETVKRQEAGIGWRLGAEQIVSVEERYRTILFSRRIPEFAYS